MSKTEFLLPDDLGWDCNDQISKEITRLLTKAGKLWSGLDGETNKDAFISVVIAEIMDVTYAMIKDRQKELGLLK